MTKNSRPNVERVIGALLIALAVAMSNGFALTGAAAQTRLAQTTYGTQSLCEMARVLSAEECKNAFANANAELDEKAPCFSKRDECERYFRRCMIGDIGRGGFAGKANARVNFIPALRGILIVGRSSAEHRVLPVVEGSLSEGLFEARAVAHMDTMESGAKARQAQASWTQRLAARSAPQTTAGAPVFAPTSGAPDSEPTKLDPECATLVDPLAYNACLARRGPKMNE